MAQKTKSHIRNQMPHVSEVEDVQLPYVDSPEDLKHMPIEALNQLCDEVRHFMISTISKTGGHLGAGLGVVELTVALHKVFNTPHDRLIWDVGHQAYPHKILTGRKNLLHTIRQAGGLSGFTKRTESIYDTFGAGHSSTSISAALGIETAQQLSGTYSKDRYVIAVIGDGAMSAGMAYEAMNNAGSQIVKGEHSRLIIILNDNGMSIAPPVGIMSQNLTRIQLHNAEKNIDNTKDNRPDSESAARIPIDDGGRFFETMGFKYIGPIDGHSLEHLLETFQTIRDEESNCPVLIHVRTQKGKGYIPAEQAPDKMHGVKKFDVTTGSQKQSNQHAPTYTDVFANTLIEIAENDCKVVGITAAMPSGTGIDKFAQRFPERSFDVGIAEQHAVTFAAGMATEGLKPFVAIYSTFLQRAYDQLIHDVAIQNLPVRFIIDRAGLVGEDGQTHAGAFDISYLSCIPNMVIMAPSNEAELAAMVKTAHHYNDGPIAIRFPRGNATGCPIPEQLKPLKIGEGKIIQNGETLAILNFGTRAEECITAAQIIHKSTGIMPTIADMRFAKPLDKKLIAKLAHEHNALITIEEGSRGGFGSSILEFLSAKGLLDKGLIIRTLTLPDIFLDHDTPEKQYEQAGLDAQTIADKAINILS